MFLPSFAGITFVLAAIPLEPVSLVAADEKKVEAQEGSDLAKGPDRFEERSKSSDGKSAEKKQRL